MLEALPLLLVLVGLVLYTVLGGADFGAGFWQLTAGREPRADRIREHAHRSMGPVWEANHVWLIYVLTVFWTAYPVAFGSIASTLAVPLFVAGIGIVFRGAAYALRAGVRDEREAGLVDTVFSIASIVAPFALGAAIGAIATGRVPVGNAAGDPIRSWLHPAPILAGILAVATCAYLAAVYLAADAARLDRPALASAYRLRALAAGVVAGVIALAGLLVLSADAHDLYRAMLGGPALVAAVGSVVAGLTTLAFVSVRRFEPARYGAATAVAAVVAAWPLARWPTILPGLDIEQAAAPHDTLVALVVVLLAGAVVLLPALALLFGLAVKGRFRAPALAGVVDGRRAGRRAAPPLGVRSTVACLIVAVGLLDLAEAGWAHAVGVAALAAFIALAFRAIVETALDERPAT